MKFALAIAALCLASTEAIRFDIVNADDETQNLVEKLGHQGAESDDKIQEALEDQQDIREHQKEQKELR